MMSITADAKRILKYRILGGANDRGMAGSGIVTGLVMKERRYIVIVGVVLPGILVSGQILPLDNLLDKFDIVLVDLRPPIHQHHRVVMGGGVVASRLGWQGACGCRRIRGCVYAQHRRWQGVQGC